MDKNPFISIIVPVYNAEKTITGCIESLLAQDYPSDRYEIIVVDNASRDGTREVVRRSEVRGHRSEEEPGTSHLAPQTYDLKYIYEPTRGSYKARNTGIKQAKGETLAFTDADCVADKNWLKEGVAGFTDDSIGCVAGAIKAFEPQNCVEEYLAGRDILVQEDKSADMPMPYAKTASAFYRKAVFDKVGVFEEKWISGGDADLCWRMQLKTGYKISFNQNAVVFHKHRSSLSSMFKQCQTWGIGITLLYKKYKKLMPERTFKQSLWVVFRIIFLTIRVLIYLPWVKVIRGEGRKKLLDQTAFLGWELGRITGSVRNGVFYI